MNRLELAQQNKKLFDAILDGVARAPVSDARILRMFKNYDAKSHPDKIKNATSVLELRVCFFHYNSQAFQRLLLSALAVLASIVESAPAPAPKKRKVSMRNDDDTDDDDDELTVVETEAAPAPVRVASASSASSSSSSGSNKVAASAFVVDAATHKKWIETLGYLCASPDATQQIRLCDVPNVLQHTSDMITLLTRARNQLQKAVSDSAAFVNPQ